MIYIVLVDSELYPCMICPEISIWGLFILYNLSVNYLLDVSFSMYSVKNACVAIRRYKQCVMFLIEPA